MVYTIVALVLPYILKVAILGNMVPSNISNGDWASFLGSYVGGSLGGLGTLIAVYITIKNSVEIQNLNKEDSDFRIEQEYNRHQQEIKQEREIRELERKKDFENEQRHERQAIVNLIAEKLGIYITHISKYYYAGLMEESLDAKVKNALDDLINVEQRIQFLEGKRAEIGIDNVEILVKTDSELEGLTYKKDQLKRKYDEALAEQKRNREFGNRLIANEAYFTIKTMLYGVEQAETFLLLLDEVHKNAGVPHPGEKSPGEWMENAAYELISKFNDYMDVYIS